MFIFVHLFIFHNEISIIKTMSKIIYSKRLSMALKRAL